ncbi:hypothetical protein U1Q18_015201 [Sarracenia purpurea var. burkii]
MNPNSRGMHGLGWVVTLSESRAGTMARSLTKGKVNNTRQPMSRSTKQAYQPMTRTTIVGRPLGRLQGRTKKTDNYKSDHYGICPCTPAADVVKLLEISRIDCFDSCA